VPATRALVEAFFMSLGRLVVWVQDTPALVLPRIICMLSNEAAFALGEGVADLDTIDKAMQLGTNYPRGPLAWARYIGYERVLAVLDHLHAEYGEERYRAAPLLRRWDRLGQISG
jgi:3-hydroxybutyryl-CoA dehydrogenase